MLVGISTNGLGATMYLEYWRTSELAFLQEFLAISAPAKHRFPL
jgi:hypothetical protein